MGIIEIDTSGHSEILENLQRFPESSGTTQVNHVIVKDAKKKHK